jgi:hypothetical protein
LPEAKAPVFDAVARIAFVGIAVTQILWSAYAIEFDHYRRYSPDLETAQFLRPYVRQGASIAVTYLDNHVGEDSIPPENLLYRSVGILPYFESNIFINWPDWFWSWSVRNPSERLFKESLPSRPAIIVVEMPTPDAGIHIDALDPKVEVLTRAGYRFTHVFCAARPRGFQIEGRSCHLIFQHLDSKPRSTVNSENADSWAN